MTTVGHDGGGDLCGDCVGSLWAQILRCPQDDSLSQDVVSVFIGQHATRMMKRKMDSQ